MSADLVPWDRVGPAVVEATGDTRWSHDVDGNFASSPEIDGDRVLVSNGSGVDALRADTGELVWRHEPEGEKAGFGHEARSARPFSSREKAARRAG